MTEAKLDESDCSAGDSNSKPQQQRDDSNYSLGYGDCCAGAESRSAMHGEVEHYRCGKECHLPTEGWTVVALQRFLREQADAGQDHQRETDEEDAAEVAAKDRGRLAFEGETEQPEIE